MRPILSQFGFLKVYSYGFFLALAILAGTLWLMRKGPGSSRQNIDPALSDLRPDTLDVCGKGLGRIAIRSQTRGPYTCIFKEGLLER